MNRAVANGSERVLLGVEDACRPSVGDAIVARELDDAAFGGEVSAKHRDAAMTAQRGVGRADHLLTGRLDSGRGDLRKCPAVDGAGIRVEQSELDQALHQHRQAARGEEIGRHEAASGPEVRKDRRPGADRVHLVDVHGDACLGRDREEVQHGVRRAAGRREGCDCVLERSPVDDRTSGGPLLHELHRETPGRLRDLPALSGWVAGTALAPGGDSPRNSSAVLIVFAVNCPPHAPAPGQACSSTARSSAASILPALKAPTASKTSWTTRSRSWSRPGWMVPP